jgi:hypothetical protein
MIAPETGEARMGVMSLEEARRVLKHGASFYSEWSAAGAVVYENHMRTAHPEEKLHYVRDTRPPHRRKETSRETVDRLAREWRDAKPYLRDEPLPLPGGNNITEGGSAPDSRAVGSRLVTRLPGPASSYFISLDPETGQAALFQTVDADGAMDPGFVADAAVVAGRRKTEQGRARSILTSINTANRKFWARGAARG